MKTGGLCLSVKAQAPLWEAGAWPPAGDTWPLSSSATLSIFLSHLSDRDKNDVYFIGKRKPKLVYV